MIEALMYGVIPIAKMVNFRKAPPEKVSNRVEDAVRCLTRLCSAVPVDPRAPGCAARP